MKGSKKQQFQQESKFESIQEKPSRNRKRKAVWFKPPYNAEVKTNTGKVFLKLVRKHFHKRHRYKKIFNTNTIKLSYSYSCTPNAKNLIKQHNSSIMTSVTVETRIIALQTENVQCVSFMKLQCSQRIKPTYFGSAEGDFKSRYNNHTLSFCSKEYKHCTELSKLIWSLQDSNTEFSLKWRIKQKQCLISAVHGNVTCALLKKQQQLDLNELVYYINELSYYLSVDIEINLL